MFAPHNPDQTRSPEAPLLRGSAKELDSDTFNLARAPEVVVAQILGAPLISDLAQLTKLLHIDGKPSFDIRVLVNLHGNQSTPQIIVLMGEYHCSPKDDHSIPAMIYDTCSRFPLIASEGISPSNYILGEEWCAQFKKDRVLYASENNLVPHGAILTCAIESAVLEELQSRRQIQALDEIALQFEEFNDALDRGEVTKDSGAFIKIDLSHLDPANKRSLLNILQKAFSQTSVEEEIRAEPTLTFFDLESDHKPSIIDNLVPINEVLGRKISELMVSNTTLTAVGASIAISLLGMTSQMFTSSWLIDSLSILSGSIAVAYLTITAGAVVYAKSKIGSFVAKQIVEPLEGYLNQSLNSSRERAMVSKINDLYEQGEVDAPLLVQTGKDHTPKIAAALCGKDLGWVEIPLAKLFELVGHNGDLSSETKAKNNREDSEHGETERL